MPLSVRLNAIMRGMIDMCKDTKFIVRMFKRNE